jgi:acyl carrier protein
MPIFDMNSPVGLELQSVFREVFDDESLQLESDFQTGDLPGWDSFKNVEILMACEERWSLRFSSSEMDGLVTVGDLAACIVRKIDA